MRNNVAFPIDPEIAHFHQATVALSSEAGGSGDWIVE